MNGDLISRSALLVRLAKVFVPADSLGQGISIGIDHAIDVIGEAPAVDAVEVVRCKDCKWLYNGLDMYCCTKHTGLALIKPDGSAFCSCGERRADDASDCM